MKRLENLKCQIVESSKSKPDILKSQVGKVRQREMKEGEKEEKEDQREVRPIKKKRFL